MAQETWQVEVRKSIRSGFHGASSNDLKMVIDILPLPFVPFDGLAIEGTDIILQALTWSAARKIFTARMRDDMEFYQLVKDGADEPTTVELLKKFETDYEPYGWKMIT